MDKLQRDGNLQPTHNESLEKCKSCISGKMACKTFLHQVERAKDLLGIIHIDICGPFRTVSREGASYFITFTDNFSRYGYVFYGYVYLMKHKHEVFETFKDCEALVKRDTPDKLNPKSIKSIFVGYPKEMMGYYFYYPLENKIFVAQNVEFFENNLIVQEVSGSHGPLESIEPQNVKVLIRRSARIPQAPCRYGFYIDVVEYELGDLDEPSNYKVVLLDSEFDKWLEAINTELQSIKDNQV
ncbi:retrotransposon protein, putative, ty1-copia subclass [Tanacetum coccineum]|uniref:Retrotransposon protein, putative, ty1-copia subclass n=1 Tax=Tanacetum coccineum TaxID=301880 RepID=A0ABQ4XEW3_9ASTR